METIGYDLSKMDRVPLTPEHVEAIRKAGRVVYYPAGADITKVGTPADRFVYVEEGEIEVVNPTIGEPDTQRDGRRPHPRQDRSPVRP